MSDLVRIFSLHGGEMSPKTKLIDQRRRDVSGAVIRLQPWDAERAAKELDGRVRETTIITASDVPHTGDFLDRIERATPRHIYVGDNKKAVKLGHTLVRVTSLPLQKLLDRKSGKLRQLFERLIGLRKHAASPTRSYPVVLDRFVRPDICAANSWERMKRITAGNQGTEGTFAVPVPWERLRGNDSWEGLALFVLRNIPSGSMDWNESTLRHGDVWTFLGAPGADGRVAARGLKRIRYFEANALRALADNLALQQRLLLFTPKQARIARGFPMRVIADFRQGQNQFRRSEICYIDRIRKDGVVCFGSRLWVHDVLLLEPAFYVGELSQRSGELREVIVVLHNDEDVCRVLNAIPRCWGVLVTTDDVEGTRRQIAEERCSLLEQKHRRDLRSLLSDEVECDDGCFLPPRSVWSTLIKDREPHLPFDGACGELVPAAQKPPLAQRPLEPASDIDVILPPLVGKRAPQRSDKERIEPERIDTASRLWFILNAQQAAFLRRLAMSKAKAKHRLAMNKTKAMQQHSPQIEDMQ